MQFVVEKDVVVAMRDGVELVADVHLPGRGPFPALLQRVPYNREAPRIVNFAIDVGRAMRAGYAVVVQDVRGRFASSGAFRPFLDDGADAEDTLAWIAAQPWCDGRVGMVGGSYAGAAQWAAASAKPSALRAIAPFVATDDPYDGWIYQNGVFELGFNLHWALRSIAPAEAARRGATVERLLAASDGIDAMYRRLPLVEIPEIAELAPFYDEWLLSPTPTGQFDRPPLATDVEVPTIALGGWYDVFQRGTLGGFARLAAGTPKQLVMGPWSHGVYGGMFETRSYGVAADADVLDVSRLQLRWLDRWVKEEENGADRDPPVTLFVMGADYWRSEDAWPPRDAVETAFFLHSDGRANSARGDGSLSARPPRDEPADSYEYDPRSPAPTVGGATLMAGPHIAANAGPRDQHSVEAREDVLCYTGAPFVTPLEVTGPITAVLFVSSTAPDTDFVVTLTDVSPHGRSEIVASGVVRARYRNSRSAPAMLTPNRPYELIVDLGGTAHVFRSNHRARLQVTSGSFPRFEPNPQTGALAAESADMRPATNRLHHDRHHPSYLMLHVVERVETIERLLTER